MGWAPLQASPLPPLETEQIIRVICRAASRPRSIGENIGRERVVTALDRLRRLREGVALSRMRSLFDQGTAVPLRRRHIPNSQLARKLLGVIRHQPGR